MSDKEKPEAAWADEPTPLTDAEAIDNGGSVEIGPYSSMLYVDPDFARDLERRLRHAWKLVNSLRIDAMHAVESDNWELDAGTVEQQLSDIEGVLLP